MLVPETGKKCLLAVNSRRASKGFVRQPGWLRARRRNIHECRQRVSTPHPPRPPLGRSAFFNRVFRPEFIAPTVANKGLEEAKLPPPATAGVWAKVSGELLLHSLRKPSGMNTQGRVSTHHPRSRPQVARPLRARHKCALRRKTLHKTTSKSA